MKENAERVVQMRGVTKTFGAVRAVDGIDVEIRRGETVALLGPNGAGKTTSISMLLGLLKPTAGTVAVFGQSPEQAIKHSLIGAMLQEGKLMSGVRVGEFLDFVRSLHPAPLSKEKLMDLASLGEIEHRRVDRLSGGQTQRVRFAMAIAGNPQLLLLDEPTAAMDVEARRDFWTSMHAYAAEGHTILFATHYLEEAETSASRLIIIARGHVIADGTVPEIQARYGEPRVTFTLQEEGAKGFEQFPGVHRVEVVDQHVTLHTSNPDATARALVASAIPWKDLEVKSTDLEETFIKLVHNGKGEQA
ncbi:MAG TPA: ABC transporter ATP-binding protein [Ktedonobacterales bacterium]|nr:ABC transporter ATP-binding protein [Ktedonobacterales bacterium]